VPEIFDGKAGLQAARSGIIAAACRKNYFSKAKNIK